LPLLSNYLQPNVRGVGRLKQHLAGAVAKKSYYLSSLDLAISRPSKA